MTECYVFGSYDGPRLTPLAIARKKTGETMSRFINPKHLMGATKNSLSGLAFAWKGEQAFRHEVLVLAVLAVLLAATGKSAGEWLLVLGGWIGVMVVELLNSADEESFDLVTTEWNEHVKRGKDMASAAIFLAMVINAGVWVYIFFLS